MQTTLFNKISRSISVSLNIHTQWRVNKLCILQHSECPTTQHKTVFMKHESKFSQQQLSCHRQCWRDHTQTHFSHKTANCDVFPSQIWTMRSASVCVWRYHTYIKPIRWQECHVSRATSHWQEQETKIYRGLWRWSWHQQLSAADWCQLLLLPLATDDVFLLYGDVCRQLDTAAAELLHSLYLHTTDINTSSSPLIQSLNIPLDKLLIATVKLLPYRWVTSSAQPSNTSVHQ